MFSIQVLHEYNGKPACDYKVSVIFEGFFRGVQEGVTNKNGFAHFNCQNGKGKIYVKSGEVFNGEIKGMILVYI